MTRFSGASASAKGGGSVARHDAQEPLKSHENKPGQKGQVSGAAARSTRVTAARVGVAGGYFLRNLRRNKPRSIGRAISAQLGPK
jgi:hypothetical protein